MSLETSRRSCPIRLDADVPNPDLDRPQESFKHRPLMQCAVAAGQSPKRGDPRRVAFHH